MNKPKNLLVAKNAFIIGRNNKRNNKTNKINKTKWIQGLNEKLLQESKKLGHEICSPKILVNNSW